MMVISYLTEEGHIRELSDALTKSATGLASAGTRYHSLIQGDRGIA
jgi:hypothetical protein